jgi:hypothetical protein
MYILITEGFGKRFGDGIRRKRIFGNGSHDYDMVENGGLWWGFAGTEGNIAQDSSKSSSSILLYTFV